MKYRGIGIAVITLILALEEAPSLAQSTPFPQYPAVIPHNRQCVPRRPVAQPAVRSVNIRVPVPYAPPVLLPCPPGEVRYGPSRTMPVRVEVAVKPETPCNGRRVPATFRDPGPLQPIISNGVGLVGSLLAAPFRVIEMFLPSSPTNLQTRKSVFLWSEASCSSDGACLSSSAWALSQWPSCLPATWRLRAGRTCRCPLAAGALCASAPSERPAEARGRIPISAVRSAKLTVRNLQPSWDANPDWKIRGRHS